MRLFYSLLCFRTFKDATRSDNPRFVAFELRCCVVIEAALGFIIHNPGAQVLMVAKAAAMRGGAFGRAYIRFM